MANPGRRFMWQGCHCDKTRALDHVTILAKDVNVTNPCQGSCGKDDSVTIQGGDHVVRMSI